MFDNLEKKEKELQNEILGIQDEVEMLLDLLERREKELIDVQQQRAEIDAPMHLVL